MSAATCKTCGRQLTIEEFRACSGIGHYCAKHLHAKPESTQTKRGSTSPKRRTKRSSSTKRGRRISASGKVEYSCKGQFAGDGVIRQGWLTSDHPSCLEGDVVFVHKNIGYGPSEIVCLFIKDPQGKALAQRVGFTCHA